MLSAPRDPARLYNLDEWWVERRLLARKMIDSSEFKTAYLIARDAALPSRDIYKTEQEFTAGWIALRFLNDPATAAQHFARIGVGSVNPTTLARAGYWKGRAAEAMGRTQEARTNYTSAAEQSTSYYGQLARAKLGLPQLGLNEPPRSRGVERLEVVRAAQLLFDLDERDIAIPIFADMGENGDADVITGLGELTARHGYARGMILVGKAALNRGMPFDFYAYPVTGIPSYSPIGPDVEKSVVFAIARQESQFNQGDVSPAQAYGLMQVTPDAGRYVCKRAGVTFDLRRMKTDSAYNAALGAAELGGLLEDYRGSYIMTFAAYNAGRGSLKKWIDRYGDPRDPEGRCGRLGGADPVLGDPQLCAADHGEPAGLPGPVRRRHQAADRGRSAPRQHRVAHDPDVYCVQSPTRSPSMSDLHIADQRACHLALRRDDRGVVPRSCRR